jgi:hypothetical protein
MAVAKLNPREERLMAIVVRRHRGRHYRNVGAWRVYRVWTDEAGHLHEVQRGTFKTREYAEALADALRQLDAATKTPAQELN